MTNEGIAFIAGVVFSFAFDFAPYLKERYGKLVPGQKRLVAAGLGLVIVGITLGLSCLQLFDITEFTCDQKGVEEALRVWVAYLGANQLTYGLVVTQMRETAKKLS